MQKNRCIYCMEELNSVEMTCPNCKKSVWEYQWQEHWMHPYTVLKERYLLGAVMKESAYSITYQAYDQLLLQRVVLKECYPREDGPNREQFLEEVRTLFGNYDQAGMPAVLDILENDEMACFVMGFLPGESLKEFLKRQPHGRMEAEKVRDMLFPVMEILSYWHSMGKVHGAVNTDNIIFDENGVCRLLGWGNGYAHVEMAPEQKEETDQSGPWTDVYGLCGIFYECITGKTIKDAMKGRKKDLVKPLSDFVDIELRTERVILQGLEKQIQRRYFCVATLWEHLGGDGAVLGSYTGAIQARWGESWLRITTAGGEQKASYRRVFLTKKQKKRILVGSLAVAGTCLAGAAGLYGYVVTHPKEVLEYKIQKDYQYDEENPDRMLETGSEKYEAVLEYALENGEPKEYDNGIYYRLISEDIEKNDFVSTRLEVFPIREAQLAELVRQTIDARYENVSQLKNEAGAFLNYGETGLLEVDAYDTMHYEFKGEQEDVMMEITSDIADDRVAKLRFDHGFEECKKILVEVLPVLVPETYLTEEEAEEMLVYAKSNDSSFFHSENAKYDLHIFWHDDFLTDEEGDGEYSLRIQKYRMQDTPLLDDAGNAIQYAGNYARGSKEYEEYMAFVKEHAVSVTKEEKQTVYELTKEAVLEWGQPCNYNFMRFTRDEVFSGMKEQLGYELELDHTKSCYRVYEKQYGVIQTEFWERELYLVGEEKEQIVAFCFDPITGYVSTLYVKDKQSRSEVIAGIITDLLPIITNDIDSENYWDQEYEIFSTNLEDYKSKDDWMMGGKYTDCGYYYAYTDDPKEYFIAFIRYGMPLSLLDSESDAPYYWPDI